MVGAKSYPFSVGSFQCAVLLDGTSFLGKERILKRFPDATEAEYRQAYAEIRLSLDAADSSFNVLLAKIDSDTILVDTGEGGKPTGGLLHQSLILAGVEPEAVTLIVITHCDGDHVLGLLTEDDRAAFANAKFVISKEEMAYWQGRIDREVPEQQPIVSMMEVKGLRLIEMDERILPGLTAVPLPGHTPGQIGALIESGNEKLMVMGDLLHSPIQFAYPEWSASYDIDTSISVPTRRAALGRVADENMLALLYHLTFPGLGRVKRAEKGFTWEPLESR